MVHNKNYNNNGVTSHFYFRQIPMLMVPYNLNWYATTPEWFPERQHWRENSGDSSKGLQQICWIWFLYQLAEVFPQCDPWEPRWHWPWQSIFVWVKCNKFCLLMHSFKDVIVINNQIKIFHRHVYLAWGSSKNYLMS